MTLKALIILSLVLGGLLTAGIGERFTSAAEARPSCSACD